MNTDRLVAGLDIGSARTTAIIGEVASTARELFGIGVAVHVAEARHTPDPAEHRLVRRFA